MATYYAKIARKGKYNFHVRIFGVREIPLSADALVNALLNLEAGRNVCLLDSCGVSYSDSRFLIAGFDAVEILEIRENDAEKTLAVLDEKLSCENLAAILTISYDFGLKLNRIAPHSKEFAADFDEPDAFLALFDCLIIHDYAARQTFLMGDERRFDAVEKILFDSLKCAAYFIEVEAGKTDLSSNFTKESYIAAIEKIQEYIRRGDTYQTNLTQQICARLPETATPERIFFNLRKNNPASFAAFIRRKKDVVISASPERFFKIHTPDSKTQSRIISAAPIKGTRARGKTSEEDLRLQNELLESAKDRAENIMIVDLLRNDIGRICNFGSVKVENLCVLETHPTLFHLVSTISGELGENAKFSAILKAVFPCGSITGAPKIRTMQIIDEIETAPRGLSMGAVGLCIPNAKFGVQNLQTHLSTLTARHYSDLSVAIRTIVVRENEAVFNVGGGIVIDSIPADEYEETLVKARALLRAIGATEESLKQR